MRLAPCLVALTLALVASLAYGADVKQLAGKLGVGSPSDQRAAADALADLGASAQEAVPQLVAALSAGDADLRWRAARALGLIGDMNAEEALRKATSDSEPLVRAQALFALGRLKADYKESLTTVISAMGDKEVQVRRAAVRTLAMIQADRKVTIPLVVKMLEDADQNVAMRAVSAIAEAGAEAVPALNAALANPQARYWACIALSEMGDKAKDAVPGLARALSDEQPQTRLQASIALAEIGPAARPAVPELTKLLGDKFEAVQRSAVFALGRIGDKSAAEAVAKADKPDNAYLHPMFVWASARLNPGDKQRQMAAIELMAANLGDKDLATGQMAARAIAELDPPADAIRPVMEKLVAGADAETADRIFSALASIGARIVPLAINALKDPSALRRERSMKVLSKIGPDAAPAVPELTAIAKGMEAKLKVEALFTIGAIGPKAAAAVPAVVSALSESDPQTQQTAAYAAGKIGPAATAAVPALKKLTASNDDLVKMTAVWALLQIGPRTDELVKAALPLLSAGLSSQREMVRVDAAMSLGQLGKAAAPALPALEKSLQDPSGNVRSAASAAIKSIKG